MKLQAPRLRNKMMLLCGVLTAGMIAAPGAFARDHDYSRYSGNHDYGRHGWHDRGHGNNVGALLAGALIGGVIVNALDHSHDYSRTYYSQPGYYAPPSGYDDGYGSYDNSGYYNNSYRSYGNSGYYNNGYRASTYYNNGYAPTYYAPTYYGDDGGY